MKDMAKKPPGIHVVKRKHVTTYYFRRRIPDDLIGSYPDAKPAGWITEKLAPVQRDAYERATQRWAELDAEFRRLRDPDARCRPLSEAEMRFLSEHARHHWLAGDDLHWNMGQDSWGDDAYSHHLTDIAEEVEVALTSPQYMSKALHGRLEEVLSELRVQLDPDSDAYRTAARAFLIATNGALAEVFRRRAGRASPVTPEAPVRPIPAGVSGASASCVPRLSDLMDYWAKFGNDKREKSIDEAKSAATRFTAVVGDLPLAKIEKAHFIQFRDARMNGSEDGKIKPVKPQTAGKDIALVSAAFQVALADDKFDLKFNPADNVRIPKGETEKRGQFTSAQLEAMFSTDLYFPGGPRSVGGAEYGDAAYWFPLVALFTGSRLTEAAQIRLDEIHREGDIDFIHFRHDAVTGRLLKTGASGNKRVPIHSELIRLGLLDRVDKLRREGESRLFPEVWRKQVKRPADEIGRWWRRYLDGIGLTQAGLGTHAFRHTLIFLLRQAGVPEDQRHALTGHSDKSVSARYGALEGYPLNPLRDAMAKVEVAAVRRLEPPAVLRV